MSAKIPTTDKQLQTAVKRFMRDLHRQLICGKKQKKELCSGILLIIREQITAGKIKTEHDIQNTVGTVEEIVRNNLNNIEIKQIKKIMSVKRVLMAGTATLALISIVFCSLIFIDSHTAHHGYTEEQIVYPDGNTHQTVIEDYRSTAWWGK